MRHALTRGFLLLSVAALSLATGSVARAQPPVARRGATLLAPSAPVSGGPRVTGTRHGLADVTDAESLYNDAISFYEINRYPQAVSYFTQALAAADNFPDRYNTYLYRGLSRYALHQYRLAQADFAQCIAIRPRAADAYVDRGNADKDAGLYTSAIADYTSYLRLVPTNDYKWAAYENRGNCYFELGGASNLRLAIADFSASIGLKSENGRVHEDRGAAYESLGSYDAALADDTTAIQQGYVDAYYARGNVHYERGTVHNARREFEAAVVDYSAYLRLSPGGRRARIVYNNRGQAFDSLGMPTRAIQDFDQALRLDPTYADAYYNRSRPEYDRGNRHGAVADLRRALALYIAQHNAVGAQRARAALRSYGA